MELVRQGINPITFPGLRLAITSDESKAINFENTPKVILSASGMCEAGRIRHHLKHNLWRPECTILFVGYQAVGTLGRVLVEGIAFDTNVKVEVDFEKVILQDNEEDGTLTGEVKFILYKGDHYHLTVLSDWDENVFVDTNDVWDDGDRVGITIPPDGIRVIKN